MISNEQIALNVTIEEMILDYKSELYKFKKRKNLYDYRIKMYNNNIRKFTKYSNSNNAVMEIRANLYLRTCEEMIKQNERYINEIAEEGKDKEEFLKHEIWALLFETITNKVINENTILSKNGYLIYSLPSAKIYFKKQEIIISDEERLYNFLIRNKLEKDYIDTNKKILFNLLKDHLYICEDGSISNDDGLLFDGVCLSSPEIQIKLNED
ncbi:hypothetical protein [Arcobacter sp.]|jgi:hypothetical protein|uniref:hypothetical protein n=1 Tax=Arcobacter sp. TaxID=1872629 RepID=UPI003D0ABE79